MSFVLDCSVTLTWCFADEATAETDALLDRLIRGGAIVPRLWHLEVGNILAITERRGRLPTTKLTDFLARLDHLPIATDDSPVSRDRTEILDLARRMRLTTYDAAYLDLAMRAGLPLATKDAQLARAARELGVAILP